MLFKDEAAFEQALKSNTPLSPFHDSTEIKIFMDLAIEVLPMPSPLNPTKVKEAR